jgi:hypothetical protein
MLFPSRSTYCCVVRSISPTKSFLSLGHSVMKQVEETLQPIADDALRDDSDYIRVIEHIGYRCSVPFFSSVCNKLLLLCIP